jgi:hypothetical protein
LPVQRFITTDSVPIPTGCPPGRSHQAPARTSVAQRPHCTRVRRRDFGPTRGDANTVQDTLCTTRVLPPPDFPAVHWYPRAQR